MAVEARFRLTIICVLKVTSFVRLADQSSIDFDVSAAWSVEIEQDCQSEASANRAGALLELTVISQNGLSES